MIEARTKTVTEYYCTECGSNILGLLTCNVCDGRRACSKGYHRFMVSDMVSGTTYVKQCIFCKETFGVVIAAEPRGY